MPKHILYTRKGKYDMILVEVESKEVSTNGFLCLLCLAIIYNIRVDSLIFCNKFVNFTFFKSLTNFLKIKITFRFFIKNLRARIPIFN